jgi:hypothetical protein
VGSGRPRDPGGWGDIGAGGGVVVRGGGIGDDDHCEIRPPGGIIPVGIGGIFFPRGAGRGTPPIRGGDASGRTGGGSHTRGGGSMIRGSAPRMTIGGGIAAPRSTAVGGAGTSSPRRRP